MQAIARGMHHTGTARRSPGTAIGLAAWMLTLAGCGSSAPTSPTTGTLHLTVIGAPGSSTPAITVRGPAGYHQTIAATQTLTRLTPGNYTATAAPLAVAGPVVSVAYGAAVAGSPVAVTAGGNATITITFASRAGSGTLWVTNVGDSTIHGYGAALLGTSGSPAPTVALRSSVGTQGRTGGMAVDNAGTVWVTDPDANVIRGYASGALALSGQPTPSVVISATAAGSLDAPAGLAFDAHGSLWVSNAADTTIVAFAPAQLQSTGSPTPAITIAAHHSVMPNPQALAFDAAGNLWVSAPGQGPILCFSASQIAASGGPLAPTVTITPNTLTFATSLAFDARGDLWAARQPSGDIVEYAAPQLTQSGQLTPAARIVTSSPHAIAFDNGGNLWATSQLSHTVVELAASRLVSGTPTPLVTLAASGSAPFIPSALVFDPPPPAPPVQ